MIYKKKILIGMVQIILILIYMGDKFINKSVVSPLDWMVWIVVVFAGCVSINEGLIIKK